LVARHGRTLLHVAQQSSLCQDDAFDAYQRALEIFLRRVDTVEPATELAWLKVVVRHEAMAIRRSRSQTVAADDLDLDTALPSDGRSVEEHLAAAQRVRRSAEALRALKPDQAKALVMKAQGLSYDEISERYGWTYTKVNRSITEGRRRFLSIYEEIETGRLCEAFADSLEALAAGSATPRQLIAIRPHLRHCDACRSTIRALHVSRLARLLLFLPAVPHVRVADILHRSGTPDVAMSLHAASVGGGGRLATAATVLGVCLSGAGAGAVCVSGLLDEPPRVAHVTGFHHATNRPRPPHAAGAQTVAAIATPSPRAAPRRTPAATSTPRANRRRTHKAKAVVAEDEFGFERTTSTTASASPVTAVAASTGAPSTSRAPAVVRRVPAPASSDPAAEEFAP
jgi:RNA polymerase sigma factor (sigma-70 family)